MLELLSSLSLTTRTHSSSLGQGLLEHGFEAAVVVEDVVEFDFLLVPLFKKKWN